MGQYYRPVVLQKNWKENYSKKQYDFTKVVRASILCYDYDNGAKLMEHSYIGNNYVQAAMEMLYFYGGNTIGVPFVWVGDYADNRNLYNLADKCIEANGKAMNERMSKIVEHKFVGAVNHDKKEFVVFPAYEEDKWTIHPLPILSCDGNGRGGGDYKADESPNEKLVGKWAYDTIALVTSLDDIPNDYTNIEWTLEYES